MSGLGGLRHAAASRRPVASTRMLTMLCAAATTIAAGILAAGTAVAQDGGLERVLVFSKTAGFRHDSIPAGVAAIQQLGATHGFEVDATEDATQFDDATLAAYDAVVWLSTTGDVLTASQQGAFQRYMRSGGGYVGIHAAADTEYEWEWYGELLGGAYFESHPPGTPSASIDVEDPDEPSTVHLPSRWDRTDEWYNYRSNPREAGVHVLARLDESTYAGGSMGDDHPIAWCTDFDGGRAWYTGGGHTSASFSEPAFVEHILGGIRTAARDVAADCGEPRLPSGGEFEKVTLDDDTENPMELDVADDGRVVYIERTGEVNLWRPDTESTVVAGELPVYLGEENGLLGIALAPDFEQSGWIYLAYSVLPEESLEQRVSRFKLVEDRLDLASEQVILTWAHQRDTCCHSAGSLDFGPDGSLYVSTGDNTNPFESQGYTPIDERPGRAAYDAQRTAANTNDLNGKVLRIKPVASIDAGAEPGPGATYTIPDGNLFAPGTAATRPEIYAMGFRNPFRFTVDPETGWVLLGDYGPDAGAGDPMRGPQGSVEFNAVTEPGNYGWPYCIRENTAYIDYDFALGVSGDAFDCASPVNDSPNNTGLAELPRARPATMWMGYTETDDRFPALGTGGAPMGGPRYHFDPDNPSPTKFPAEYDGRWFIGEWNNNWIKTVALDEAGNATEVSPFPSLPEGGGYKRPMDMEFGTDGSLYLIEWGSGFGGGNADSGIYRIDHVAGSRAPVARATAHPSNGAVPLEVSFSSEGSHDPDGGPLTYAWDLDGDGATDSTASDPAQTYAEPGVYNVRLRVTDDSGATAVDNLEVVAGNTRPDVSIRIPQEGGFADLGERVPYELAVTDPEEGSTAGGDIPCEDVVLDVYLGHVSQDTGTLHTHPLDRRSGCDGTFETLGESGHGPNENLVPVIEASYRDDGLAGGDGRLTGRVTRLLQPKRKQAEHYVETGRTADGRGDGDPGVRTEPTTDSGGGLNIGFVEDGDYVSYAPVNFANVDALTFRVASAGAGGTIEVRVDAPTGPQIATAAVEPTGGWQAWEEVRVPIPDPGGTHEVFLVFRHPTATGGLMNLNWVEAEGRGVAITARPEVTVAAAPTRGTAPLEVRFDGEATDPDGEPGDQLAYEWDFGIPGDGDRSSEQDPTFIYEQPGPYTAQLAVTDPDGGVGRASVEVRVDSPAQCPQRPRSDEFDGDALDTERWEVLRADDTHPFSISDGELHLPIANGTIYGAGTSARNIIVQPLPEGEVAVTAKLRVDELTENYHQAGLRVYSDDDNWASVHMIHAGGQRDFEFIYEANGNPRNEAGDKLGGIPDQAPLEYWVRLISDGSQLRAEYSYDGVTFQPVGRPASLDSFENPRIGPVALSDAASSVPMSHFDWIRFDPDLDRGGAPSRDDSFDGTSLDRERWNAIVRENQETLEVGGGQLTITTEPGDIYTADDTDPLPRNFILQSADHAASDWVIETKLSGTIDGGYSQGGLIAYLDDDNYVKLDAISDQGQTQINRIELRSEQDGAVLEPQPNAGVPAGTADIWLRLAKEGTAYSGEYSFDGEAWSALEPVSNAAAAPDFGLYAFGVQQGGDTVSFDHFALDGATGCPEPENAPPTIESVDAEPSAGFAPLTVRFDAVASDPDGDELSYAWDFDGDGSEDATGASPNHTYAEPGAYEAEVTVSDGAAQRTGTVAVEALERDDPEARFRVLVFSKTAGFRHSSIDEGHAALEQLGEQHGFQVDHSEDASLFRPEVLSRYDTVAFHSTTGDVLDAGQQDAFETYIRAGGGYVGIHAASDTEYGWRWYGGLVGAYFRSHPANQIATVLVDDHDHPSTASLPASFARLDEWYNLKSPDFATVGDGDYSPRGTVRVLASVDESTYAEDDGSAAADDHPITWCQRYDGGRSWYTAMGHTEASYEEEGFLLHLLGGLETAAGAAPAAGCGVERGEPPREVPPDAPPAAPGDESSREPIEAALRLLLRPSRDTIAPGRRASFRATVRNHGDAVARAVRICVDASRGKLRVRRNSRCKTVEELAPGERANARFRLRVRPSAAGHRLRLAFTADSPDAARDRDRAVLDVGTRAARDVDRG